MELGRSRPDLNPKSRMAKPPAVMKIGLDDSAAVSFQELVRGAQTEEDGAKEEPQGDWKELWGRGILGPILLVPLLSLLLLLLLVVFIFLVLLLGL